MSERKVQNKYYPPDYDPSKVPRVKRKNKQKDVRIMAPVTMKCNSCGEYISPGKKFNAKKETIDDEKYNDLLVFRFYIRCPTCMATIIFRTDPKETCYKVEQGATESFMAFKQAEKEAREQAEAEEEEEKIDPMKQLEKRTKASRLQMEASEQIRSIRSLKYQMNSIDIDSVIRSKQEEALKATVLSITAGHREEDGEIRAEAKRLLKRKAVDTIESNLEVRNEAKPKAVSSGPKILTSSLSILKKKIKVIPKVT